MTSNRFPTFPPGKRWYAYTYILPDSLVCGVVEGTDQSDVHDLLPLAPVGADGLIYVFGNPISAEEFRAAATSMYSGGPSVTRTRWKDMESVLVGTARAPIEEDV